MRKQNLLRPFLIFCLIAYLTIVCWLLFVNVGTTERSTYYVNPDDHFVPFQGTIDMIKLAKKFNFQGFYLKMLVRNIIGNLVLLLPWGLLSPLIFRHLKSYTSIMLSAFLISFCAEAIQFLFSLGIFDVDDIIYNTFGAMAGFFILQFIRHRFKTYRIST